MKQCCLLILVAALSVATAWGQDEDVLRPNGRGDNDGRPRTEPKQSTRFIIGPELGLNMNFFSSTIEGGARQSPINAFKTGSGISPFFGLYFEAGLNRQFGIGMRLLYDMKSFGNSIDTALIDCETPVAGANINGFSTFVAAPFKMQYKQSLTYLTFNPLLRWSPSEELIVHIGPVIQMSVSNVTTDITRTLDSDGVCRWTSNGETVEEFTIVDSTSRATRVGLDVGVGYRIALAPSIALVPRLGYQYMFSPYAEDATGTDASQQNSSGTSPVFTQTDLKLSSLQASIALWFTL